MPKTEPKVLKFDHCPACGLDNRLVGTLQKKEKAAGHMRPNVEFYVNTIPGVIADKALEGSRLVGSTAPGYSISLDVCTNCGCMYAVKIDIGEVKMSILPQRRDPELFMGKG